MNTLLVIVLIIIGYCLKGVIWIIIDSYLYKSTYHNPMETLISIGLWPIIGSIKTFNFFKKKWFKS